MKVFGFYISLFIILLIASCKPEELPPVKNGNPVFSVSIGSKDIIAGENDFYLFTDYEKDDMEVYSFIARFAKTNDCTVDCKEELLIAIRDAQQTTGAGGVDIENALTIGNYPYSFEAPVITNDSVTLSLTAHPEAGAGPSLYQWTVVYDGTTYTQLWPFPDFSYKLETNLNIPPAEVCLTILSSNNCQIAYCDTIDLNSNDIACQADFTIGINSPALLQLDAEMLNGNPPFTFFWNNDTISQTLDIITNGAPFQDTICVTGVDVDGCTNEICKVLFLNQQGSNDIICSSRFSYEKITEPGVGDSLQLGTVLIQYTDTDGMVYRSDFQEQSNLSDFTIIAVEDYENNENGDKTKKLTVSGNCVLYDEFGASKDFPFEGIIAVAYP